MSALSQRYDVQRVPMVGSSGGGLVALLGACEVAPQEAVARAFALCREAGVYERPLGLFGIWRGLVHRWADKRVAARMGLQVLGQAQVMQGGMGPGAEHWRRAGSGGVHNAWVCVEVVTPNPWPFDQSKPVLPLPC